MSRWVFDYLDSFVLLFDFLILMVMWGNFLERVVVGGRGFSGGFFGFVLLFVDFVFIM